MSEVSGKVVFRTHDSELASKIKNLSDDVTWEELHAFSFGQTGALLCDRLGHMGQRVVVLENFLKPPRAVPYAGRRSHNKAPV